MENLNSVCYISKINKITPIEGADKIELATINGWTSVVQKGIHMVGDRILCVTTDAVIPQGLAEKWGVATYLRKGNRVRTVKLKGVFSECILIPLNDLNTELKEFHTPGIGWDLLDDGKDLQERLGIFKYEEPEKIVVLAGGKKVRQKDNPNFNKYYKFPNLKNAPNLFTNDDVVVITRKIHGTNARYGIVKKAKLTLLDKIRKLLGNKFVEYEFVYGSHNVIKGSDTNGFYKTNVWDFILNKYDIKNKLWQYFKDVAIKRKDKYESIILYGEIYGPGIQGEKYSYELDEIEFVGFDIEINKEYTTYGTKDSIFRVLGLPQVPLLYVGPYSKEEQDKYVLNQYIGQAMVPHEGVVVTCVSGNRHKIAKVINPEYLTYSEKHLVPDGH